MTTAASSRRSQAERSGATRAALMDACLVLLAEVGYARTTTQAVAAAAGVSRGAQLHHFPTKQDLVVSAIRYLYKRRQEEIRAAALVPQGRKAAPATGLDQLSRAFEGPLFLAALEVWVAARTDPDLLAAALPLEREIGDGMRELAVALLGLGPDERRARDAADLTLELLRGVGIAVLLDPPDVARRRRQRLIAAWRRQLEALLEEA